MHEWRRTWHRVSDFLRGATGEGAYERYCEHLTSTHPDIPLPTRAEFFRTLQDERWEGVRRCC